MTTFTRKLSVLTDEELDCSLRIAFASSDGVSVNQHFGSAKSIVVYGVGLNSFSLITAAEFGSIDEIGDEDKLVNKLQLLEGCVAVYCRACGASAVRQLLEHNIQPLKVVEETGIKDLIKAFQKELTEGPSTWLAKAIERQKESQFAATENWFE